jgi:3D (Asp-Asp-Asp) domain-containing protein
LGYRGLRLKGLLAFGVLALWLGYAVPAAGVASGASIPAPPTVVTAAAATVAETPSAQVLIESRAVRSTVRRAARLLPTPAPAPTAGDVGGLSASQAIQGTATSYCLTGRTATGTQAGPGAIAVDPTVIKLGSHLYVTGYGYGWAVDTGSAIKGTLIDVWYPCAQAITWGRRAVTIYVLNS